MDNIHDVIKKHGCIEGGTYEAYIKAAEVLQHSIDGFDKLIYFNNQVKISEFIEAVKILMTFASKHPDEHVELYYCEMACNHFKKLPCPGSCMLSDKATTRCPYYTVDNSEEK